jgi:amidase
MHQEGAVNLLYESFDPSHRSVLDTHMIRWLENPDGVTKKDLLHAMDSIAALRPTFDRLAEQYDAIVTPSTFGSAPVGLESTGDMRFNAMWTALHVPVLNVPGFASAEGMPIGLSLVAPR